MELVVKICTEHKIPVYISDTDQVSKGCVAALGPNQYEIGKQTAEIINKIKNGRDINSIEVEFPSGVEIVVNPDSAKKIGLTIPEDILNKAKQPKKEIHEISANFEKTIQVTADSDKATSEPNSSDMSTDKEIPEVTHQLGYSGKTSKETSNGGRTKGKKRYMKIGKARTPGDCVEISTK
jgi:hypothetical protein